MQFVGDSNGNSRGLHCFHDIQEIDEDANHIKHTSSSSSFDVSMAIFARMVDEALVNSLCICNSTESRHCQRGINKLSDINYENQRQ